MLREYIAFKWFSLTGNWCHKNNSWNCEQMRLSVEVCTLSIFIFSVYVCKIGREFGSVSPLRLLNLNYAMGKLFNSGYGPTRSNIFNNRLVYVPVAQRIGIHLNDMLVLKFSLRWGLDIPPPLWPSVCDRSCVAGLCVRYTMAVWTLTVIIEGRTTVRPGAAPRIIYYNI